MTTPLDVRCPHEGCGAEVGEYCKRWNPAHRFTQVQAEFHPERIAAARIAWAEDGPLDYSEYHG